MNLDIISLENENLSNFKLLARIFSNIYQLSTMLLEPCITSCVCVSSILGTQRTIFLILVSIMTRLPKLIYLRLQNTFKIPLHVV